MIHYAFKKTNVIEIIIHFFQNENKKLHIYLLNFKYFTLAD